MKILITCFILTISCTTREIKKEKGLSWSQLPNPPIILCEKVEDKGKTGNAIRGVLHIALSQESKVHSIWNDDNKSDLWGFIELIRISNSEEVLIKFNKSILKAKKGQTFPKTGLFLVDTDFKNQKILIASRFRKFYMKDHTKEIERAKTELDRQERSIYEKEIKND